MNREEAINLIKEKLQDVNLVNHSLAVGAIMKGVAKFLGQDEKRWELCGILHDIDYSETKDDPNNHSLVGGEILKSMGFDDEFVNAVKSHNEIHGIPRESLLAKALFAADPLSGLIVATALVMPDKKLMSVKASSVMKKFKTKEFARGANREHIKTCESELNIPLEKFIEIALDAMKEIGSEIGL
ncbi:MAG: HDIG domain-containing protein [Caldisericia bacterium]|jgi:putative nucleotidyltransferase with HDIG domain|nr:HDIG domain-containing protein [Caldisericia bacterium]